MGFVFPTDSDEKSLNLLREYRASLDDPQHKWPREWFESMSYSRWAADVIIQYAQEHMHEWTVIRSVETIRQTFLEYSCYGDVASPNEPTYIFQIAEQTASCMLDILYAYSG